MDYFYLGILIFLCALAVFDLSVGVANDAVNFLSPAVGAKSSKFRNVLIVAAIGIFVGASTSSGMMDIARHGIMNPIHYSLDDVLCIFLAVSATDVILLDIFNTLGMPTSTTVSMVFGLLGGSTALALSKMISTGAEYADLINTNKALQVIIGIFLSVAIAFVFGYLVMWLTRLVFTFNFKKHLKWSIAIFGGISITSIFYFLLVSGLKNSKILVQIGWTREFIDEHTWQILGISLLVFTVLMQILHLLKVNIFKIIVLFGTFSLAMAFAGNDLVNFIGTPLAGVESFLDFTANNNGVSAEDYKMSVLAGTSTLPYKQLFLIGAGIIMTISLCTSKKAHKVVQTTVNLSRQDSSEEVFSSSRIARKTVRNVINTSNAITKYVPTSIKNWVNTRFDSEGIQLENGAAFDLVRASINLVLAGLLIVIGTTLQLPLSTTYVAFMVAMGSSLADRAWGRDTAVYRITGVISVIGGWFITAGAAFIMACCIAALNHFGGGIAMLGVIGIVVLVLVNNNRKFKKKQASENVDTLFREIVSSQDKQETWQLLKKHVSQTQTSIIATARESFVNITSGLVDENIRNLRAASIDIEEQRAMLKRYRKKEILGMRKIDHLLAVEKNTWFHLGTNSGMQILYGLKRMLEPCIEHVDNNFNPLPQAYVDNFKPISEQTVDLLQTVETMISSCSFENTEKVLAEAEDMKTVISGMRHNLENHIQKEECDLKISLLYLSTLQETQELVSNVRHLLRASKRFQE